MTGHLEALALATSTAIETFPYPAIPVSAEEVVAAGKRLLATSHDGSGDVWARVEAMLGQIGAEVERNLTRVAEQYSDWWKRHAPRLRTLANELHRNLVEASVVAGQEGIAALHA